MAHEIKMPQMGESVTEGTITEWYKDVGDHVERNEPLLEITTDKVDSEVTSSAEGILVEKRYEPGDTVEVDAVVAVLDAEAEEGEVPDLDDVGGDDGDAGESSDEPSDDADDRTTSEPTTDRSASGTSTGDVGGDEEFPSRAELRRKRSTPLVRRMADEHGIDDLTQIEGSGLSGRVTKEDIQQYIDEGRHLEDEQPGRARHSEPSAPAAGGGTSLDRDVERPDIEIGDNDRVEAMGPQRQMIAEHMVRSRATSPHAHTVHEVDFEAVVDDREARKDEFADQGVDLTYTAYLVRAAVEALREYPLVNATIGNDEENVVYRGDINIGIAVAIEKSLVVPVVEHADELSLKGIARRVNDLADRARNRNLETDEVHGGTFTISNHGVFGPEFGIPIINQPQAAIVSTGAIKKRVVVDQETEAIQVKPTSMWCMSFDHRIIDGATADRFMKKMRTEIEEWSG